MSKKMIQRDYFNTELIKLFRDAESYILAGGCERTTMRDLRHDVLRSFDNSFYAVTEVK